MISHFFKIINDSLKIIYVCIYSQLIKKVYIILSNKKIQLTKKF